MFFLTGAEVPLHATNFDSLCLLLGPFWICSYLRGFVLQKYSLSGGGAAQFPFQFLQFGGWFAYCVLAPCFSPNTASDIVGETDTVKLNLS